jgi:flavorubredoxin
VEKKIEEVVALNVPVNMICTSHGIIWRDNPLQIVNKYMEWAKDYNENQVTLIYDSMWDATRKMAEAIAEGIKSTNNEVEIKLYNTARTDKNDIITEVFKSKLIIAGSSTINKGILYSIDGLLEMMRGLSFKGKKAAAFGSYGWSGESVAILNEELKKGGFELIDEGLKVFWVPDEAGIEKCKEFGRKLAAQL